MAKRMMNVKIGLFLAIDAVIVSIVLFFVFAWNAQDDPSMTPVAGGETATTEARERFLAEYRSAHEEGDIAAAMQLVCRDGVSENTLDALRESMQDDFRLALDNVELVSLDESDPLEYTLRGVRYIPNLQPVGKLRITLIGNDNAKPSTTYLVGIKNGRYLITTSIVAR